MSDNDINTAMKSSRIHKTWEEIRTMLTLPDWDDAACFQLRSGETEWYNSRQRRREKGDRKWNDSTF